MRTKSNTTILKQKPIHEIYGTWASMTQRCYNEKSQVYRLYGGRGITVCDEWRKDFKRFLLDMGERPEGYSLDRIDNNGNYCKENCRWTDNIQQQNNKRNTVMIEFDGETYTRANLCRKLNVTQAEMQARMKLGLKLDEERTIRKQIKTIHEMTILKAAMNEKKMTVTELKNEVNRRRSQKAIREYQEICKGLESENMPTYIPPTQMTEHTIYGVINNNKNWTRESITEIADILDHEIEIVKKKKV